MQRDSTGFASPRLPLADDAQLLQPLSDPGSGSLWELLRPTGQVVHETAVALILDRDLEPSEEIYKCMDFLFGGVPRPATS
eukprot:8067899-Pyramimonas_sp.AAC.1